MQWAHASSGHDPSTRPPPETLREDFSGSGMVSVCWIKSSPTRRAWAVDFDKEVHEWGREKHLSKLKAEERDRVALVTCDVLRAMDEGVPKVDVIVGNNYSWQCWLQDKDLDSYLASVLTGLNPGGMLVLDAFGGTSIKSDTCEEISVHEITLGDGRPANFTYIYEQLGVKPDGEMTIGVSFGFTDGSIMKHAFKYNWRARPVSNVCGRMRAAGFRKVCVFVDFNDETGAYRYFSDPIPDASAKKT